MRRLLFYTILVFLMGFTLYWLSDNDLLQPLKNYVENQDVLTLEARYSPEAIMEEHKKELLSNHQKSYQDSQLKYYPHLLMEVKFVDNKKPREGVILWSQTDGEMVINTESWEKTHGFEDAINANATASDFKVMNLIAEKGPLSRERLQKELNIDEESLNSYLDSALKKHLTVLKGNEIQLHMENPKFLVAPQTKMTQWLVTKPFSQGKKVSPIYSQSKIEKVAKAAFGSSFSIKSTKEIFLPVYSISVLNGDGSILNSDWNAINGSRIQPSYKYQAS
ncbi:Uncharacterized protein PHSC3_000567 [Chlamydiales bacterium STE3]|nr:Uncharacterized protein PHSC3_000567 [Chlamydiales bacterium STE3]